MKRAGTDTWFGACISVLLLLTISIGALYWPQTSQHQTPCKAKDRFCHMQPSLLSMLP